MLVVFLRSLVPGMLATCSVDKTVTLWDTYDAAEDITSGPPRVKMNKDMKVGKLYTLNFYPSSPWLLACAGGGKEMALWDMAQDDIVQKCFGGRANKETPADENTEQVNALDDASKKEAFDAMMTSEVATSEKERINETKVSTTKKKKDKGKKKKVHRAGR
jgi:WD40 repeat protein